MKNIKKALIGTALAGSLVASAGFGTYSWFTSETQATGTIENGTLTLGEMGPLFNHQNFAPSQLLVGDWNTIENTGSLNQVLKATYHHEITPGQAGISKYKVGYIALKFKEKPNKDVLKDWELRLGGIFNGTTNPTAPSLSKAASSEVEVSEGILSDVEAQSLTAAKQGPKTEKTFTFGNGDNNPFWNLKNNEFIKIIFGVKLDDSAGDEFQGVKYDATFKVIGKQTDEGAQFAPDQVAPAK